MTVATQTNAAKSMRVIRARESGQAAIFLLLGLGVFLLGGIGLAVDMANMWFHHQAAQNAADAACTAAAMDLVNDGAGATNSGGFTPGTAFNCSSNPTTAPCQYASFNGYTATTGGLVANNPSVDIAINFPSSVPGVQTCSTTTPAPAVCTEASFPNTAFVSATVTDRTQSFFVGLLSGRTTMDVPATAKCGAVLSNAPIPILVLDPRDESIAGGKAPLNGNGKINITIVGGPQRSIQVDGLGGSAVSISGGSGSIDLTQGGPLNNGSDFGVTGTTSQVGIFQTQNTGKWIDPTASISDPFATLAYPSTVPGAPVRPSDLTAAQCASIPCPVPPGTHGCQVTGTNGDTNCLLYTAGHYTIDIQSFRQTLIFDPGLYYMDANLLADQQSCLRPATGTGDGSGGTIFYFNGTNSVNVTANAGRWGVCATTTKIPLSQIQCVAGSPSGPPGSTGITVLPANVIANNGLQGDVLLGPCQAPTVGGTNYGDPLGIKDPLGVQRGMLFFQDRSADLSGKKVTQPSWGGGGAFGLMGIMYFHYCKSADGAHLGSNCDSTNGYQDELSLQGGSASTTFVVGDIITDKLSLGGNPAIEMDLNPNALYYVLKASLLQ